MLRKALLVSTILLSALSASYAGVSPPPGTGSGAAGPTGPAGADLAVSGGGPGSDNGALAGSILPTGTWAVAFDDEFNGTSLDTTKWPNTVPSGSIIDGQACSNTSAITESGGVLQITGLPPSQCSNSSFVSGFTPNGTCGGSTACTGGEVITAAAYGPGYYEARVKAANDAYSVFWMIGGNLNCGGDRTHGFEGDIMEDFGGNQYQNNTHWDGYGSCHQSSGASPFGPISDGFHTVGMLWDANSGLTFYLDGTVTSTLPGAAGATPSQIRLTSYTDHANSQPLQVDWVRYYQPASVGGGSPPPGTPAAASAAGSIPK